MNAYKEGAVRKFGNPDLQLVAKKTGAYPFDS